VTDPLIESLTRAVEATPYDVRLRTHLAELLVQADRSAEAVTHCAVALQYAPTDERARTIMTRALSPRAAQPPVEQPAEPALNTAPEDEAPEPMPHAEAEPTPSAASEPAPSTEAESAPSAASPIDAPQDSPFPSEAAAPAAAAMPAPEMDAEPEAAPAPRKAARTPAKGKGKALVLIVSGGKLSAQSPNSRLGGWLHQDIGLEPVDPNMKEGSHGMPISFEYIKEKNPDWLFVLDRSAAIGEEGKAAKDVLDNPLVAESTAWKKGQVVYLDSSAYLAAGGAKQLQTVAKQAAEAFKKAK